MRGRGLYYGKGITSFLQRGSEVNMFTKSKMVRTKKDHKCLYCDKTIEVGSLCTYGVTTDSEFVGQGRKAIYYGHICKDCFDYKNNLNYK